MVIEVRLVHEDDREVASVIDELGCLPRLLPSVDDRTFCLIRFIDPYGNTVFNHLQMADFLEEWSRLISTAESAAQVAVLKRIEWLARECDLHLYLRFEGD